MILAAAGITRKVTYSRSSSGGGLLQCSCEARPWVCCSRDYWGLGNGSIIQLRTFRGIEMASRTSPRQPLADQMVSRTCLGIWQVEATPRAEMERLFGRLVAPQ